MSDARGTPTVLIAGNPNAGKTTLFNLLTGARAKVGNYPGVTVDRRSARLRLTGVGDIDVVDLPGTYSLTSRSAEEKVSVDTILGGVFAHANAPRETTPHAIVLVVDATALRRGLYFALQVLGTGIPLVLCLNMMDEARDAGIDIDCDALGRELGCEVVPAVARKGEGRDALCDALRRAIAREAKGDAVDALPGNIAADVEAVERVVLESLGALPASYQRTLASWALLSLGNDDLTDVPAALRAVVEERHRTATGAGRNLDEELVLSRYERIDAILGRVQTVRKQSHRTLTDRIDAILVHPIYGLAVFAFVMALVFEALFSGAEPLKDGVDAGTAALKTGVLHLLPAGAFRDLITQGILAGVGNVIGFVPQIAMLFIFITVLEDSGYLARVAFVIDRVMGGIGLNGKAFVPMLSGFACAIPAVMATRTMESRRDRLLTMLVIPLTSCSARLPVYILVAGTVFNGERRFLGVMSPGAVALFAMYSLSIVAAIGAAYVLRRTALPGPKPALVLELPPYRMPSMRNVVSSTWQRVRRFLIDAGTVILALTIALWALLTYPKDSSIHTRYEAQRADAAQIADPDERKDAIEKLEHAEAGEELRHSAGGRLGTFVEPALEPLGFDYRIGVGILGAFAAREVFVSTLGIVFDVGEADEHDTSLRDALREAKHPNGAPVFTPLVGVSLMVFFVLACQCMSTLAVVRRESGSWKWPALLFAYMSALAYVVTLVVYQVGHALGWGTS